jgi:hypothetical protein
MTAWQVVAVIVRLIGIVCVLPGLFLAAGGVRTIVSGRLDERRRSANSLRFGVPLLVFGVLMLFSGSWLANWAVR